ncbi:MAG: DUF4258 domain-containing protein [Firmicutes bacterium]|nr:DUF4258 domain-containing protein [Bacillota bacterium]
MAVIDINKLKKYFEENRVFVTEHAAESFRQRGIKIKDIRNAINNGEIIEQYPNDFPFSSCLILGMDMQNNKIHICISDEGSMSRIITAYYPDKEKWSEDLRVRKESEI